MVLLDKQNQGEMVKCSRPTKPLPAPRKYFLLGASPPLYTQPQARKATAPIMNCMVAQSQTPPNLAKREECVN